MQPSDLICWLAHPADFAAGVALYAQLGGRSPVYRPLFALGETRYSRQVLERELQALAGDPASTPAPIPLLPAGASPPASHTDAPEMLPLRARLRGLRDERSQLHVQLTAPHLSEQDRGRLALRILALGEQMQQLLQAEAHVLRHGALSPDLEAITHRIGEAVGAGQGGAAGDDCAAAVAV